MSNHTLRCLTEFTNPDEGAQFCSFMQNVTSRLDWLPAVVVTVINGAAFGGGAELSTIGDIRLATPNGRVCWVHKNMGLSPGWGGSIRLLNILGRNKSAYFQTTSNVINSNQLLDLGYVQEIIDQNEIESWISSNLESIPLPVLRSIKLNLISQKQILLTPQNYQNEAKIFKSLYAAEPNKIALQKVLEKMNKK